MIWQSGFRTAPLYSVEVGSWRFKERLSGSQTAVPQAPLALMKFFSKLLGGIQLVSPQRTQRDVNFTLFQLRLDVLKPLLNLYQLLFLARACIPGPVIHIQSVVTTPDLPTQHVLFLCSSSFKPNLHLLCLPASWHHISGAFGAVSQGSTPFPVPDRFKK